MKKIIGLLLLASFGQIQAANLTINGFSASVNDPKVIENIQKIASCSPKKIAKKSDYAQVMYLSATRQYDLMAKYLIESCITLNNEEIKKQELAKPNSDEINFSNPMRFINSQESLLYMFAAKAPIDKVDGKDLILYLAFNPTNFNTKDGLVQKKFGKEGVDSLKKEIAGTVLGNTIDINKVFSATQQQEESYELMLATLVKWMPASVRVKEEITGNFLAHHFAYLGRYNALKAITEIEPASVTFTRLNTRGETPKMIAFNHYCVNKEKWQKENFLKVQLLLTEKISSSELIKKNTFGNSLPDYIKDYIQNSDDKEANLLITNQIKKSAPDLFKNPNFKKITYKFSHEFCTK